MRVGAMKCKFLKFFPERRVVREFDVWNFFNEGLYVVRFVVCSYYQESTVFMNLIFFLLVVISYGNGNNRL